jgi:hypothetical protein
MGDAGRGWEFALSSSIVAIIEDGQYGKSR